MKKSLFAIVAVCMSPLLYAGSATLDKLQGLKSTGQNLVDTTGSNVFTSGQILVLSVSVIAFAWVSYAAIAKFRECQVGRADWSELLVLGVAAGAILVFVTILLSEAGFLVKESEVVGSFP